MPIVYFNKKHFGKIALAAVCLLMITGVCLLVGSERKGAVLEYATNDEVGRFSTEVSDIQSKVGFFEQFGIKIKPASEYKDEIIIPEKFNVTYKDYNRIQKQTGFNLENFKGVKARRFVYTIKSGGKAVILVYKGNVIAGHIESGVYGESYKPLIKGKQYGKTR